MAPTPPWWDPLVEFTAARCYPGGTVAVLRETGRLLISDPSMTPHHLSRLPTTVLTATTGRLLSAFFTVHGLALAPDRPRQLATARRERFLAAIAAPLRDAVVEFDHTQISEQDRRRRTGQHIFSDITLETRLRILRDLAAHLHTRRTITGWAEVATADLETFLARAPAARHQRTYVLRRFFAWAKGRKLILTDPTRRLSLGAQPAFTGTVLDIDAQRALFARWTSNTTPGRERLVGLLALLHAASNAEIRGLRVIDIDTTRRTVALAGRPFPTPLDPPTWTALQRCLADRDAARTLNPHVIVTRATSGRDTPADSSYLTRLLAPAGTTPQACRQTRLTELVNDLDPKLAAVALGINNNGLVRYADLCRPRHKSAYADEAVGGQATAATPVPCAGVPIAAHASAKCSSSAERAMFARHGERTPALRGAGLAAPDRPVLREDSGEQECLDQGQHALVRDSTPHPIQKGRVRDLIKARGDVAFQNPLI